jgi:hypothetical protein
VNERSASLLGEEVACANEANEVAHVRLVTQPDPYRRKPRPSVIPRRRGLKTRWSELDPSVRAASMNRHQKVKEVIRPNG